MKIKVLIYLLLMLVSIQNIVGQVKTQYRKGDSIITGAGCSQGFYTDYVFKPQDINTYKHIAEDFGKDKFSVYYKGMPLEGLKTNKTTPIYVQSKKNEYGYSRRNGLIITDGNISYYNENQIKDLDTASVYYMFDERVPIFKSNENVYYEGHLLKKLNVNKTTIIDSHPNEKINFFTDGNVVYCNEFLIKGADTKTFKRGGYKTKIVTGNKYKNIEIADSYDQNYFYKKGERVTPYPGWKKTKIFADSIYNDKFTVAFISSYQKHTINAKPVIDFYLTGKKLEKLTRNIKLFRKKKMRLNEDYYFNEIKGYYIKIYNDKHLIDTYYYAEDLEEFDIGKFTDTDIVGDGFHFSKEDFNLLRSNGKPIKYYKDSMISLEKWKHKISSLKNDPKVIHIDSTSLFYEFYNEKKRSREIYEYKIENDLLSKMHTYDGIFILKIKREEAKKILGKDIMEYNYYNRKNINDLIEETVGEGNYFIDVNSSSMKYIKKTTWINLRVYCSFNFMKKVKSEFKASNWQPIIHTINWETH